MSTKTFSLVEMLVVISILMVLASLLQPSLKKVVFNASVLHCQKNMKEIGVSMDFYLEDHSFYPLAVFKSNPTYLYGSWDDLLGQGYDGRSLTASEVDEPHRKSPHKMYVCPQQETTFNLNNGYLRSYALNGNQDASNMGGFSSFWGGTNNPTSASINEVPAPSTSIVLAEIQGRLGDGYSSAALYGSGGQKTSFNNNPEIYHQAQFNYLFADLHSELLLPDETWDTQQGTWIYGKYWTRNPDD